MLEIKCIIFDWGGVLIDNPVDDFAIECSKVIGIEVEELKSAYGQYAHLFERGLIKESELWDKIGNKLSINIQSENSIWYECFKKIYSPRKNIFNLAKQLNQNGYLVALLSNTETPAMNFFIDQKYEMFDYKVFSCKESFAKPDPELYNILLQKIKIPAQQTLFIDDKFDNIETAEKININSIQYVNDKSLFENLQKYNIDFLFEKFIKSSK